MDAQFRSAVRWLAAVAVLAAGVLHLNVWRTDYRTIPNGAVPGLWVVKVGFPVNAALSLLVVVGLALWAHRVVVWVGALTLEAGSIVALVLSRQASIFGWQEPDWSTKAKVILAAEVVAVVAIVALVASDVKSERSPRSLSRSAPTA